jgi:hypothetical protein
MHDTPLSFALRRVDGLWEFLAITVKGSESGEATVHYLDGNAHVDARVDLLPLAIAMEEITTFHQEFATELVAFLLNRGSTAHEAEGAVTYALGSQSLTLDLPTNPELGLGYPNSW